VGGVARTTRFRAPRNERHTDKNKKTRSHIRQLEALGYTVTLSQAA
jgi:hypothetical protein